MQKSPRLGWAIILLVIGMALQWGTAHAQTGTTKPDERKYFPQSGHWVMGDFLVTYLSVPNPEQLFGYPITEAYQEQIHNKIVQYFERARFELSPDGPDDLRVKISPLGKYLYEQGKPLHITPNFQSCKKFTETSFQVCYAFREFFEANGGVSQFGYPISNFEYYEQRIVQHFQRARFEWHPELPSGSRVVLAPLGRLYFDELGEDTARLNSALLFGGEGTFIPQVVLNLKVRAFPGSAVLSGSGAQTLHILVQDQNLLPVYDAEVVLKINLPSGKQEEVSLLGQTDHNGVITYTFDYENQPIGVAEISVKAMYANISGQTKTSFRIWW